MFWVMLGVIVMILCTGLLTLRAAIRSNKVKYGKTYIKHVSISTNLNCISIMMSILTYITGFFMNFELLQILVDYAN
jgi:hypothetical protein